MKIQKKKGCRVKKVLEAENQTRGSISAPKRTILMFHSSGIFLLSLCLGLGWLFILSSHRWMSLSIIPDYSTAELQPRLRIACKHVQIAIFLIYSRIKSISAPNRHTFVFVFLTKFPFFEFKIWFILCALFNYPKRISPWSSWVCSRIWACLRVANLCLSLLFTWGQKTSKAPTTYGELGKWILLSRLQPGGRGGWGQEWLTRALKGEKKL